MKGYKKTLIIIAICLVAAGAAVFVMALKETGGDWTKLNAAGSEEKTFVIEDAFKNINVSSTSESIKVLPSEDGKCRVECYDSDKVHHTAEVTGGTLEVKQVDDRKWYEFFEVAFGEKSITVYLPEKEYDQLKITDTSGSVEVSEQLSFSEAVLACTSGDIRCSAGVAGLLSARSTSGDVEIASENTGSIEAESTSGSVKLNGINCGDIKAVSTSGGIKMKGVIALNMTCRTTSGSILLEDCDAESLELSAVSGSVEGNLLSDKVYVTSSTSGSIDVPGTVSGGSCRITTTSGSIRFR